METCWKYCLSILVLVTSMGCDKLSNETYHHLDPNEKIELSSKYVVMANVMNNTSPKRMRLLEKAIRLNPRNDEAWVRLAEPYLQKGLYKEWSQYNDKAIKLNPEQWQAQRGQAKLFYFRDFAGALYDFDVTDTLTVDKPDYIYNTSVDYLRGLCYYGLKNHDKATEYFNLYLKTENEKTGSKQIDKTAFLYLGMIENYHQNYEDAIKILEKAIGEYDHFADIYYQLALSNFMLGNIEVAAQHIEKSKKLFDQNDYHKQRFRLYEMIDQLYLGDIERLEKEIACFQ